MKKWYNENYSIYYTQQKSPAVLNSTDAEQCNRNKSKLPRERYQQSPLSQRILESRGRAGDTSIKRKAEVWGDSQDSAVSAPGQRSGGQNSVEPWPQTSLHVTKVRGGIPIRKEWILSADSDTIPGSGKYHTQQLLCKKNHQAGQKGDRTARELDPFNGPDFRLIRNKLQKQSMFYKN